MSLTYVVVVVVVVASVWLLLLWFPVRENKLGTNMEGANDDDDGCDGGTEEEDDNDGVVTTAAASSFLFPLSHASDEGCGYAPTNVAASAAYQSPDEGAGGGRLVE